MSTGFEQQSGSWLELLGVPVSWQVILLSERLLAAPIQEHPFRLSRRCGKEPPTGDHRLVLPRSCSFRDGVIRQSYGQAQFDLLRHYILARSA